MFSKPTIFLAAKSSKRVSSFCRSSRPSTFSCAEVVIFFMQSGACPVELSGLWTSTSNPWSLLNRAIGRGEGGRERAVREVGEGKNERGSECSSQSVPRLWACPVEFDSQPEIQPLNLNRRETRWLSRLLLLLSLPDSLLPARPRSLSQHIIFPLLPPLVSVCGEVCVLLWKSKRRCRISPRERDNKGEEK